MDEVKVYTYKIFLFKKYIKFMAIKIYEIFPSSCAVWMHVFEEGKSVKSIKRQKKKKVCRDIKKLKEFKKTHETVSVGFAAENSRNYKKK